VRELKKLLMVIAGVAITVGIGIGASKVNDQAGNPPIGSFTDNTEVASTFTTMGNPPIGS
jgi:hypothetical protein